MHLVVASEHDDVVAALEGEIAARALEWHVTWLPLGDSATASAGDLSPDALVCLSGGRWNRCQLMLDEVHVRQPHAVRILLMDIGHEADTVQLLDHAHRVLPEPLDAHAVIDAILGVLDIASMLEDPALKEAIERAGALPSAPRQYIALTRLMRDPDVGAAAITAVVSQDPVLAARVLRLSNSAYYAAGREIGDLRSAVIRVGQDALRRLVLASEVFESGADADGMRDRALRISRLSEQLLPGTSAGLAATAGLLAEVGLLMPHDTWAGRVPHGLAGAYLLGMWGLPQPIVEAVACHQQPARMPGGFWLAGAVHVASNLVNGTKVDEDYLRRVGRLKELPRWRALADAEPKTPHGGH